MSPNGFFTCSVLVTPRVDESDGLREYCIGTNTIDVWLCIEPKVVSIIAKGFTDVQ